MADEYIKREAFVAEKRKLYCEDCERRKGKKNGKKLVLYDIGETPCRACDIDDMIDAVEDFPAADVRPVVRGRWVDTQPDLQNWQSRKDGMAFYCSACGHRAGKHKHTTYQFCPWCGADMREAQHETV